MLMMLLESGQGRLRLLLLHEDSGECETAMTLAQRLGHVQCHQMLNNKLKDSRLGDETLTRMVSSAFLWGAGPTSCFIS
jgi:hypothetical protein